MPRPTKPALTLLFDEARHVVSVQTDAIDAFDEKASTLLRFNVLLLGVLVTAVSLAARLGPRSPVSPVVGSGLVLGVACLLASTLAAIVAYRRLEWNIGVRAESLRRALGYDADEEAVFRAGLRAYTQAMARNASKMEDAVRWLDRALVTLMLGLVLLSITSIALWVLNVP